ncbi:MAG: zinc-ribbon domain-containing protein [Deltaproteobacteria bacterium]|jgi:hypothetical protein|nr:zinc-ribbon domain-containing protein [Deltaproteobacteria bacterium]
MSYCTYCGELISDSTDTCPECGEPVLGPEENISFKDRNVLILLCFFFWSFRYSQNLRREACDRTFNVLLLRRSWNLGFKRFF